MKPFILSTILALVAAIPSTVQVTSFAQSNSATNPSLAGQAPDEVMTKLSGLYRTGKIAEAQQLAAGLLLAYPDDPKLAKVKALLDKLVATQTSNADSSVTPPANSPSEHLSGMDKVEYNSLKELARQAQETTELDEQKPLLQKFMKNSGAFLKKHPEYTQVWQLRAASAISLNDPDAGYEAGQHLLASANADNDPSTQKLLAELNLKGWLNKHDVDFKYYSHWICGKWKRSIAMDPKSDTTVSSFFLGAPGPDKPPKDIGEMYFVMRDDFIMGYRRIAGVANWIEPDYRGQVEDSGEIKWEFKWVDGWHPIEICKVDKANSTMKFVIQIPGDKAKLDYSFLKIGELDSQTLPDNQSSPDDQAKPAQKGALKTFSNGF